MAATDVVGGRLSISFEGRAAKSTELTAEEAYDLLKYADGMRRKRRKFGSLKSFDRAVCGMHDGGMSVPAIADALKVSQARVEGAIGRVESGRYGEEGVI